MPVLALVYCILLALFFGTVSGWVMRLAEACHRLIASLGAKLGASDSAIAAAAGGTADRLAAAVRGINPAYLLFIAGNFLFLRPTSSSSAS
jgi:enoyl-CoA hydratase/carnithine racemase